MLRVPAPACISDPDLLLSSLCSLSESLRLEVMIGERPKLSVNDDEEPDLALCLNVELLTPEIMMQPVQPR